MTISYAAPASEARGRASPDAGTPLDPALPARRDRPRCARSPLPERGGGALGAQSAALALSRDRRCRRQGGARPRHGRAARRRPRPRRRSARRDRARRRALPRADHRGAGADPRLPHAGGGRRLSGRGALPRGVSDGGAKHGDGDAEPAACRPCGRPRRLLDVRAAVLSRGGAGEPRPAAGVAAPGARHARLPRRRRSRPAAQAACGVRAVRKRCDRSDPRPANDGMLATASSRRPACRYRAGSDGRIRRKRRRARRRGRRREARRRSRSAPRRAARR